MKKVTFLLYLILICLSSVNNLFSYVPIDAGDPSNNTNISGFFKSRLTNIENESGKINKGIVETIALSPGGLPVYAVYYGKKDCFMRMYEDIVTKYGQATRKDGSLYGWLEAKSNQPMKGNFGILSAYFEDHGINIIRDEFFHPMAKETKATLGNSLKSRMKYKSTKITGF